MTITETMGHFNASYLKHNLMEATHPLHKQNLNFDIPVPVLDYYFSSCEFRLRGIPGSAEYRELTIYSRIPTSE
jgi:hypothetical protein